MKKVEGEENCIELTLLNGFDFYFNTQYYGGLAQRDTFTNND